MMLRTGSLNYHGTPVLMEYQDISNVENMPSPRTFGSHLRFRFLPEQMKLGTAKVITITRNPKDVVVSVYYMLQSLGDVGYTGTFEGLLKRFFSEESFWGNGSWFAWMEDVKDWKISNILCISYEDFKQDTFGNIVKLASFLEVDHDNTFLKKVEQKISFAELKKSHNIVSPASDRWKNITEEGHLPIYRKGRATEKKKPNYCTRESDQCSHFFVPINFI